jgi:hypothetical protein
MRRVCWSNGGCFIRGSKRAAKLALAIAAYKQANEIWPTLSSYALMGGLQLACGLKADAGSTYRMCIDRAEAFGAVESSDDCKEIIAELRQALRDLAS